ncbi:DedA family protein [Patescibacteria group bacterium]|nr:DedA family protein [Patescibacteria group bacterium]MBU1674041.1 DedA family protein [Patescibacteria group bacterium]MBU1963189.1 DedA family protein [Patescibacteria group bacterium]
MMIQFGYWIAFLLVFIEGPIVTVIAGFLASLGYFNFVLILIIVIVADFLADVMYYLIGRWGGRPVLKRVERWTKFKDEQVDKLELAFKNHAGKTLIIGKFTNIIGAAILVIAGIARVPFYKFVFYNGSMTILKSFVLICLGYFFGSAYVNINSIFGYIAFGTIAVMFILMLIYSKKIIKYFYETPDRT